MSNKTLVVLGEEDLPRSDLFTDLLKVYFARQPALALLYKGLSEFDRCTLGGLNFSNGYHQIWKSPANDFKESLMLFRVHGILDEDPSKMVHRLDMISLIDSEDVCAASVCARNLCGDDKITYAAGQGTHYRDEFTGMDPEEGIIVLRRPYIDRLVSVYTDSLDSSVGPGLS